jgi:hypothetical protein
MPTPQFLNDTAADLRRLANELQTPKGFEAIDWTTVKKIITTLLSTLGPLLLQILVDWLTPVAPPPPPAKKH